MSSKRKKILGFDIIAGGVSNNPFVQAWIDEAILNGFPIPNNLTPYNDFMNAIDGITLEGILLSAQNDPLLSQISTISLINPIDKATLVNSPLYNEYGFLSNGTTSYVRANVLINRRLSIENDFCYIFAIAENVPLVTSKGYGGARSSVGSYSIVRTASPNINGFVYNGITTFSGAGTFKHFIAIKNDDSDNTKAKSISDGVSTVSVAVTPVTYAGSIHLCAWNDSNLGDTPLQLNNSAHMGLFIWAQNITDAQSEIIRTAWNQFLTDIGL